MIKTINEREIMNIAKQAKVKKKRRRGRRSLCSLPDSSLFWGNPTFQLFHRLLTNLRTSGFDVSTEGEGGKKRGENGRKKTL